MLTYQVLFGNMKNLLLLFKLATSAKLKSYCVLEYIKYSSVTVPRRHFRTTLIFSKKHLAVTSSQNEWNSLRRWTAYTRDKAKDHSFLPFILNYSVFLFHYNKSSVSTIKFNQLLLMSFLLMYLYESFYSKIKGRENIFRNYFSIC